MKSLTKQASVVTSIDNFLSQVSASSTRTKSAEAKSEAGGYEGGTSHPVKNVDDQLHETPEGERSRENSSDVKEQEGPLGVESTSESINKGQDETNTNLGMHQSAVGEDSKIETGSAKGGKEDASEGDKGSKGMGKTTHPARTNNESLDGGKYSSARNLLGLIKEAEDPGRDLVARIAVEANGMLQQRAQKLASDTGKPAAPAAPAAPVAAKQAAEAGADLASIVAGAPLAEKQALEQAILTDLAWTIQESRNRAVKTAQFCNTFFPTVREKQGGGEPPPPPQHGGGDPGAGGDDGSGQGGGGMPPGAAGPGAVPGAEDAAQGMGPEGGGGDEEALIQALLGGGQGGGGMPGAGGAGGGMGGPGGDPSGGMGGGMGGGAGGVPELSPEDIAMLEHILKSQGHHPEEAEAKAAAQAFRLIAERQKTAGVKVPEWKPKTAAEAQRYQAMSKFVTELMGR